MIFAYFFMYMARWAWANQLRCHACMFGSWKESGPVQDAGVATDKPSARSEKFTGRRVIVITKKMMASDLKNVATEFETAGSAL